MSDDAKQIRSCWTRSGRATPGKRPFPLKSLLSLQVGCNDRTHAAMIGIKRGIIEL